MSSMSPTAFAETRLPFALIDACAQLDADAADLVARTCAWSAVNSGSLEPEGLAAMADLLLPELSSLPGAVTAVPLPPTERVRADGGLEPVSHGAALRLVVRPDAPIQAALTGHFDTVFPRSSPFQTPRFLDDDTLNGPGVADMKGGLVVMLAALSAFERLPGAKRVGYEVLLSPDEEIGSPASAPLLADLGRRAHVGLVYEPALANGAVVDARKGSGNYQFVIAGRAAHVGRAFQDGRSAIVAAADAVMRLDALNGRREGVTVNVGAIDGGAPVNMVPPGAVVRFNVRAPDAAAQVWAEAEIQAVFEAIAARDGIRVRLHGGFGRAPKPLTPAQETILGWTQAAGRDLGLAIGRQSSGGVCEGNNLAAAGCPNIDTLGPRGGHLHSPDEFALVSSFPERTKLSLLLLAGLESGRYDVADLAR